MPAREMRTLMKQTVYCSVVYHSMLTVSQAETIEKMQRQAVRLAFGYRKGYAQLCEENNIETLEYRRSRQVDRFVQKCLTNPRYRDNWFPTRDLNGPEVRDRRIYLEANARTSRFFNSPLSFFKRRANDLLCGGGAEGNG